MAWIGWNALQRFVERAADGAQRQFSLLPSARRPTRQLYRDGDIDKGEFGGLQGS